MWRAAAAGLVAGLQSQRSASSGGRSASAAGGGHLFPISLQPRQRAPHHPHCLPPLPPPPTQVRSGVGGEWASSFAGDLLSMYKAFSLEQGWQFEVRPRQRQAGSA